jgi:LacI family transcriptional regulator
MSGPRAPVTLKSLAEALRLDVSTVSRVLNGSAEAASRAASSEVVERIRTLAKKWGYRPNVQAASLKTRRSREFAVLIPRVSDLVVATIYEGINEAADEAGYIAFVSNTMDDPERQRARAEQALHRQVAGLIIGDTHLGRKQPLLETLAQREVPFVLVSRRQPGQLSVTGNDELGGRLAAEHLFALGHRNVAVLAGESHASTGADRTRGFLAFYREQGIEVPAEHVLHGPFDTQTGRLQGKRLFGAKRLKRSHPTALFAVNDFLAIGAMGVLRDLGLQGGHDVAIVGYNDTPLAAELPISLTSVRIPMMEMGRLAVGLMLDLLEGKSVTSVLLQPQLQIRSSSGAPLGNT